MDIRNKRIPQGEFEALRAEVLTQWPTGKDVNIEEAVAYHKALPEERIFSKKLIKAKEEGRTLVQPRAGVPVIEEHIKLMQFLEKEGEADLLPSTIDSYTRQNRYVEAENGIKESIRLGRALMNGFPAVNHGVSGCRRVVESVNTPVQVRHGTPDARLLTEITYAGGFTSYEGGGVSYNLPYCKNVPMERTIKDWQYVDRLTGLYEEMGVSINREPYGPLTGTLVPPCVSHAVAIIEALLAAEQGVKNITVGYGQCGNLVQDIAAIQTLQELTDEYLQKFGYNDVVVTTVLHQWMGGFPADEAKAFAIISLGSLTAALSKATKVIVKSPHEAVGIPTMEANAEGLRCTKQTVNMLVDQEFKDSRLEGEKEIIRLETRCIVDKCYELGEEDFALGTCRGVEAGVLDIPFAPCRFNAGIMLPCRDNDGAIRILKVGNLPFTEDLKKFHEEKVAERARHERREPSFQMVIDDVYSIGKGHLVGRPRY
ncbi:MAG TPA: methylaspartate mutase subunit E [Bacillota bacterium]|nr:methylaspartate mutase subunit E [Bacillota bacterium]HQC35460.1 methylaspartate mutase subunit E [Bacillota bacterium]